MTRRRARFFLPLGLFLLVVFVLVFLLRPKPIPPPVVPAYTPQQATMAQQHVDTFSAQLLHPAPVVAAPIPTEVLPQAASRTPPAATPTRRHPVQLQLSEADINTILATNPKVVQALRAYGVNAVQVLLHEPQGIDIRAAVVYKGQPANMEVAGTLQSSPKTIVRFVTTHAQVGRMLVPPGLVTKQAYKIADQFTQRIQGRLPFQVQTIQIRQKNLILSGVPLAKVKI